MQLEKSFTAPQIIKEVVQMWNEFWKEYGLPIAIGFVCGAVLFWLTK